MSLNGLASLRGRIEMDSDDFTQNMQKAAAAMAKLGMSADQASYAARTLGLKLSESFCMMTASQLSGVLNACARDEADIVDAKRTLKALESRDGPQSEDRVVIIGGKLS